MALGLAITYGLMGVINMAHGELLMVGAYATWAVCRLFRSLAPGPLTGTWLLRSRWLPRRPAVGAAMERSVIRWLYGRPLETCWPPGASR